MSEADLALDVVYELIGELTSLAVIGDHLEAMPNARRQELVERLSRMAESRIATYCGEWVRKVVEAVGERVVSEISKGLIRKTVDQVLANEARGILEDAFQRGAVLPPGSERPSDLVVITVAEARQISQALAGLGPDPGGPVSGVPGKPEGGGG